MFKRKFDGIEKATSVLGFGTMRFPMHTDGTIDVEKTGEMIDYAMQNGITYYDTAYFYHEGESENVVRQTLTSKYPRESYFLADKMPAWCLNENCSPEHVFNDQLKKCGVEYFDFYLCHALNKKSFEVYKEYLLDFLIEKKREGKIKYLGFSFHDDAEAIIEIANFYKWDFAQIQLNYYDYEVQNAKLQYEELNKRGIPVVVMEPVRGGSLANMSEKVNSIFKDAETDSSIASWAIRYAMNFDGVMTVLSGMSSFDQVKDNINTATNFKKLTESQLNTISTANEQFKKQFLIECTGCRYCMDCPYGVDIPENFRLYNKTALQEDISTLKTDISSLGLKASTHCQKCNACVSHCPQHIDIPKKLQEITDKINKV